MCLFNWKFEPFCSFSLIFLFQLQSDTFLFGAINPCSVIGDVRINAGNVCIGAARTPWDNSELNAMLGQWATAVALTCILTATGDARTKHKTLFEPLLISVRAFRIRKNCQRRKLQYISHWFWLTFSPIAPAWNQSTWAKNERQILLW